MRIGIDCRMYSSHFTGIGRYVYELTENLFKLDHKNEYVLFFNEPEYSTFRPPAKNVTKVLVNAPHYSLKEQTSFLKILNRHRLDLMHFTHFNRPIFYSRPSVVTIHDLTLHFYPGKKMNAPWYRFAYNLTIKTAIKKAKNVIAVSNNTKKDIQDLFKTPSEKIQVIYEGVNQDFFPIKNQQIIQKVLTQYQLNKPYLLYTGVWRSHKNLQNLLKAFHILKNEYEFDGHTRSEAQCANNQPCPADAGLRLVITGRKDPVYAPEIEQQAQSLQLENDIIFTGLIDEQDLVPLYNGATVYVFPSLYEGFGLPPLEAMQCGVPVAASKSSSVPEVCGEGNALFFDPEKPADMAEKIFAILSQPTLRQTLISRGLERVKQFSWKKMAEETLEIYNS